MAMEPGGRMRDFAICVFNVGALDAVKRPAYTYRRKAWSLVLHLSEPQLVSYVTFRM